MLCGFYSHIFFCWICLTDKYLITFVIIYLQPAHLGPECASELIKEVTLESLLVMLIYFRVVQVREGKKVKQDLEVFR